MNLCIFLWAVVSVCVADLFHTLVTSICAHLMCRCACLVFIADVSVRLWCSLAKLGCLFMRLWRFFASLVLFPCISGVSLCVSGVGLCVSAVSLCASGVHLCVCLALRVMSSAFHCVKFAVFRVV